MAQPVSIPAAAAGAAEGVKVARAKDFQDLFSKYLPPVVPSNYDYFPCYTMSNEHGTKKALQKLTQLPSDSNTVVAVGGLSNLNLFSVRPKNVTHLLILDFDKNLQRFWFVVKKIILESKNRFEAYKKLADLKNGSLASSHEERLKMEMESEESFLSDEMRFSRVKEMFVENRFAFCNVDLRSVEEMRKVRAILEDNGHTIDLINLTNVLDWSTPGNHFGGEAEEDHAEEFLKSASFFIQPEKTIVIHSGVPYLRQSIHRIKKGGEVAVQTIFSDCFKKYQMENAQPACLSLEEKEEEKAKREKRFLIWQSRVAKLDPSTVEEL